MRFTVAITVFESEYFLPHVLDTVLAQTHPAMEILVYSDGPSPKTAEIIQSLPSCYPIRYQALERRPGLHGNHLRRRALEDARGTHVCIVGHDCLLYPTYLQTHAENLAGNQHGMSVVPVAYWRETRKDIGQPRNTDLMRLKEGEIDLLCIAYPRDQALRADCFGESKVAMRCADFLAFDRLRILTAPCFRPVAEQAAHF